MKKLTLLLTILFINASTFCQTQKESDSLVLLGGSIYANVVDKSNNLTYCTYRRGTEITFSYKYTDRNGKQQYFVVNNGNSWDFTSVGNSSESVKDFKLRVLNSNMNYNDPKHYQVEISYIIEKKGARTHTTGLIENEKNIWLHPPRQFLFQILELNPFPFIKYPLQIGRTWSWELEIGDQWGDKRWKEWSGDIMNKCQYKISGKETLNTAVGSLECYVVESEAKSELGTTKLTSYFNEQFGFVKLMYTNINSSTIEINIQRVQQQMDNVFKPSF
ncbi:hypothetical protein CYCD_20730 [Tenuifilaceae bacterium CYCD]|nr:hypothetical protein CYCD_20730 [Tenuifilaceae bacterium CYCD]